MINLTDSSRVDCLPPDTRKKLHALTLQEPEHGEAILRLITGSQDATFEQLQARQVGTMTKVTEVGTDRDIAEGSNDLRAQEATA